MKTIPQHTLDFIDSWLTLRMQWETIPGISVVIAKNDQILLEKSYGKANLETDEQLTPNHIFRIASHSKTFTATAIMQLQEAGKLHIDDPVINYIPWLSENTDTRWRAVTIRQLLSHSAGVVRDGLSRDFWELQRDFPDDQTFRNEIQQSKLIIDANTRLKYSNYGFGLLGYVIEHASGESYADYVRDAIITPLGLTNTCPEYEAGRLYATGYSRESLDRHRYDFPHVTTGALMAATGFCSTAHDLAIYWQAQTIGSGKLLSDESKREMQRLAWQIDDEPRETYGLGLVRTQIDSRETIGHSGGFPGFITNSAIDVGDGISVIVLTNCHGGMASVITEAIFGLIDEFGDSEPDEDLLKYEGRFDVGWGTMQHYVTPNGLRQIEPNSWWPLRSVTQFGKRDGDTFIVTKTNGYEFYGESIQYHFASDGTIDHVIFAGSTIHPTIDGDVRPTWK